MKPASERVAAGVAVLDERDPDWWRADATPAIDLAALDLGATRRCILGQRCPLEYRDLDEGYSPYTAYAIRLHGDIDGLVEWAIEHGFDHYCDEPYGDLTAEWVKVITARREAVPEVTS